MFQAGLRAHEWCACCVERAGAGRRGAFPYRGRYSGKKQRLVSFTVAGAAPESRQHCVQVRSLTGFPVSLRRPMGHRAPV